MEQISHRVVFVSGGVPLGGSTTFLLNLAGELVRRRFAVLVVSLEHDNPYANDFARAGVPMHLEDERRTIFEDRLASALRVVRRFEPTAVISCLDATSFEILRYVPEQVKRIGIVQSDDPAVYKMVEAYAESLDAVAGVSAVIVDRLKASEALRSVSKHYLPYGVPMPAASSPRAEKGSPLRILYLGRIANEQKRVHLFPRIFDALRAAQIPFAWTIVGDGPDRATLESEMSCRSNHHLVSFKSAVPYDEISEVLDNHDIFLLASDYEGLPLSLLEAMGNGLVPVVSNLPSGLQEVVDPNSGFLVPVDEIEEYANKIVFLHFHRAEVETMSRAARDRVETNYSVAAMADRWLRVLDSLQGGRAKWPNQFSIQPVLTDPQVWKYFPVLRPIRRLIKRLRTD